MNPARQSVATGGEAGFSILEMVISMVILMTVLVSVSSLLVTSFKVGANSRYRQAATELATSTIDNEVQAGATTLVTDVGDTALSNVTSAGQTYVMEMEVSPYFPGNAACASPASATGAMLKVTVWVTWANVPSGSTWWVSGSSGSTGLLVEETTLLALPPSAFNSNDGTILVDVTGAAGNGVQGVAVSISHNSTTVSATTTSSGCALFANLVPGTWTVTGAQSGYIDSLDDWNTSTASAATLSTTTTVQATLVAAVNWSYDKEATVTPTYTLAASGSWLPVGLTAMPLTFYTSYASLAGGSYTSTTPGLVYPYLVNTNAPIIPSYYVVPGSCGAYSDPGSGSAYTNATTDGQGVTLTSGSSATPTFPLTATDIVVTHAGAVVSGAGVTATVSNPSSCGTGSLAMPSLNLGTSCVPGASCASNVAYRKYHGRHHNDDVLVSNCTTCSTTTTLSTPSSVVYGAPVSLTATVACAGGQTGCTTPSSGTVTFTYGGATIGTATVSGGTATFSGASATNLPFGSDSVIASYGGTSSGSPKWSGSTSSSKTQTVTAAATTTVLTSTPNPSAYGASATLTATVSANSPSTATPVGTVTFKNGATTICNNVTLSSGVATCVWTSLSGFTGGTYNATAAYTTSSTNFTSSTSSTLSQLISAATTTTTLTSSSFLNASTLGASVTFTATVASSSGATPVGTVTFTANGAAIAACATPVTLTSGAATCTTSALAAGSDAISAVFTPTSSLNFATSTGTMTQFVYSTTTTASIISGLPYGSWTLTVTGQSTSTSVTVLVQPSGITVGGVAVTGYITLSY